jgi:hypothetical protein
MKSLDCGEQEGKFREGVRVVFLRCARPAAQWRASLELPARRWGEPESPLLLLKFSCNRQESSFQHFF